MGVGALLIACLALDACEKNSTGVPGTPRALAARYRMSGTAASKEADSTCVTCLLDLAIELGSTPRRVGAVLEYDGVHSGHMNRTILDRDGNGISLWPDVYGSVVVRSIPPDRIQILIPVNATAEGRFYRELSMVEGEFGSDDIVTGTWNCAPFDIHSGGYVDTTYIAPGTWTLVPIP